MSLHLVGSVNFAGERRDVFLGTPPDKSEPGTWLLVAGHYVRVNYPDIRRRPTWRRALDEAKAENLLLAIYGPDFTEAE